MLEPQLANILPDYWQPMSPSESYRIVEVPFGSPEYDHIHRMVAGSYYKDINGIYKVQNPVMYAKFKLKQFDYRLRGNGVFETYTVFHDTSRSNVLSIVEHNFDVRYATRFRFGSGIYFSSNPESANRCSNRNNGKYRSMFLVDVIVQNVQTLNTGQCILPDFGYDTVTHGDTLVKYFDNEYYPAYFVDYVSKKK